MVKKIETPFYAQKADLKTGPGFESFRYKKVVRRAVEYQVLRGNVPGAYYKIKSFTCRERELSLQVYSQGDIKENKDRREDLIPPVPPSNHTQDYILLIIFSLLYNILGRILNYVYTFGCNIQEPHTTCTT